MRSIAQRTFTAVGRALRSALAVPWIIASRPDGPVARAWAAVRAGPDAAAPPPARGPARSWAGPARAHAGAAAGGPLPREKLVAGRLGFPLQHPGRAGERGRRLHRIGGERPEEAPSGKVGPGQLSGDAAGAPARPPLARPLRAGGTH